MALYVQVFILALIQGAADPPGKRSSSRRLGAAGDIPDYRTNRNCEQSLGEVKDNRG